MAEKKRKPAEQRVVEPTTGKRVNRPRKVEQPVVTYGQSRLHIRYEYKQLTINIEPVEGQEAALKVIRYLLGRQ